MSNEDYFARSRFAEELIKHIKFVPTPFTLGLNAPWGCGKSFFINHVFIPFAKKADLPVVIYDAFEHERDDDVFVSLVTNILEQASLLSAKDKVETDQIISKIANTTGKLVKTCVKIGANAASKIILKEGLEEVTEKFSANTDAVQIIGGEIDKTIEKFILSRVKNGNSYKELKLLFQQQLADLASSISEDSRSVEDPRLVIVVDELDRCTPKRALDVLETLHHLINSEKLVFLISYYKEQLQNIVEHTYGKGIDSSLYLKKFINYDIEFPETDSQIRRQALKNLANDRFAKYSEKIDLQDAFLWNVFHALSLIDNIETISQRETLCFASMAILCARTTRLWDFVGESEFALIIYWVVRKPEEVKKLTSSKLSPDQLPTLQDILDYKQLSAKLRMDSSILNSIFEFKDNSEYHPERDKIISLIKNLSTMS